MVCPLCGRAAAERDRFCGGCGSPLADACRQCGRQLDAGVTFCTGCGVPTAEPGPVAAPAAPSAEDRRRVSVLFLDLVDFTTYAERTDPEVVRRLQSGLYATARRVVAQYGGVVEKYIGDAVMALFGAPVATETDTLRCVLAGLELQRVLTADDRFQGGGLRCRVGIATGEALVDVAAARDGGQAIVAGDVVNTAARIEALAPPGGVLVCGRTRATTAEAVRYAEHPPVTLRGRSTPTEVWQAEAALPQRRASLGPDLSPLIEREHELDLLSGALQRAVRDRTPSLVTIFGQAGIGKSRLARELRQRADDLAGTRVVWHTGQCPPFGENVTYAGLADIVKAEAGILDNDSTTTVRRRLELTARELAAQELIAPAEADRLLEALAPLVGLPATELSAEGAAEQAGSAWRRFLVALARRGPTVLVFEDLHWADEPMLRFIELLAATARDVPLLVLGTSRPQLVDRNASWAGTITGSSTITLSPLRTASMTSLCGHLLGPHLDRLRDRLRDQLPESTAGTPTDLLPALVSLTDGNPLYAEEYVRMLVERGNGPLAGTGRELDGIAGVPMPDSVHAVIANRLDLLEPADRAVLQAAAVVGTNFWSGAVAAALGSTPAMVERSLRRLEQREFISEQPESTMAGQHELRFGHVLVRDVCYQRLPRAERVTQHARTADWLEAQSPHRDLDLAGVLAHHRRAACEIARSLGIPTEPYGIAARRALYLAARRAYALHALDAATTYTTQALALLPTTDTKETEPERMHLELLRIELAFYQDRTGFLHGDGADRLRALARRLSGAASTGGGDGTARQLAGDAARAWTLLGQMAWLRADHPTAQEFLGRAVELFEPLPDSREKVDAYSELARVRMMNYESADAVTAAKAAAAIADRLGLVDAQANARVTIATASYELGDPAGLTDLQEVTEHCRSHRLLALRRAARNLAHLVREEGDWPRSQELLLESRQLDGPGGHNVLTDDSAEGEQALFNGELDTLAAVTQRPGARWSDLRLLRAWVRLLREEPAPGHAGDPATGEAADEPTAAAGEISDEITQAVTDARRSGFYRTMWPELAWAARCRALQHRRAEAAELLTELTTQWRKTAVVASGEWVAAAAFAAAFAAPELVETLHAPLAASRHHTRWTEAALHTLTAGAALASGDPATAGDRHLAAARIYRQIPTVTEQMHSLALATAALTAAGAPDRAAPVLAQVRQFAQRRSVPGLLRLTAPAGV